MDVTPGLYFLSFNVGRDRIQIRLDLEPQCKSKLQHRTAQGDGAGVALGGRTEGRVAKEDAR